MSCSPPLQMEARPSEIQRDLGMDGHFSLALGQHEATKGLVPGTRAWSLWKPKAEPTSPGAWDGFPPSARRELAHEMAGLVTSIFNSSAELGEAPSDWRIANVVPIFKSWGEEGREK